MLRINDDNPLEYNADLKIRQARQEQTLLSGLSSLIAQNPAIWAKHLPELLDVAFQSDYRNHRRAA